VAAGGIITLIKTIPTIIKSVKGSMASLQAEGNSQETTVFNRKRPEPENC
jgi:hypothetical protein